MTENMNSTFSVIGLTYCMCMLGLVAINNPILSQYLGFWGNNLRTNLLFKLINEKNILLN